MRQEQGRLIGYDGGRFMAPREQLNTFIPESNKNPSKEARKILKELEDAIKRYKKSKNQLSKLQDQHGPLPTPEPKKSLFVNGYNGNFAQHMTFDETKIGKALHIAHLDGIVLVTQMSSTRQRSIEANPDGSVSAKRNLLFGQDLEEKENKENPLKRVVSTPEGWRIEVNDGKIMEKLQERNITGQELQKQFIRTFNSTLRKTLMECVLKEKLTGAKDGNFMFNSKVFVTLFTPSLLFVMRNIGNFGKFNVGDVVEPLAYTPLSYLTINALNKIQRDSLRKNFDHFWEYFMPPIEIDKVAETFIYLLTKGRKLVEKKRPQTF